MLDLASTLNATLVDRFITHAARIRELAGFFSESQFWQKAFPFGNSFGHLVLHLTGNLNYYIGAQIANTGYVRDRQREFTDPSPPSKEKALERLDDAVVMVIKSVRGHLPADWTKSYSGVGTSCTTHLDIVVHCAAHMQHHIGQMIYIGNEWQRQKPE